MYNTTHRAGQAGGGFGHHQPPQQSPRGKWGTSNHAGRPAADQWGNAAHSTAHHSAFEATMAGGYGYGAGSTSYAAPNGAAAGHSGGDAKEGDFEVSEVLGRGAFSVVVRALHTPSGMEFALKRLSRWSIAHTPFLERCVKWEINVHRLLRHPNILRLHSYFCTDQELVLVLELCERGTLLRRLRCDGNFDEARAARYARQIVRGLHYLHSNGVLHRDLKLENVLIDTDGRIKIADFGLSWQQAEAEGGADGSPKSHRSEAGFVGTLDYLAPEVVSRQPHTPKGDVWAVGVMVCEMLTGRPPFYRPEERATMHAILHDPPALPAHVSPHCIDFINAALQKDPRTRPTAEALAAHPWILASSSTGAPALSHLHHTTTVPHGFRQF